MKDESGSEQVARKPLLLLAFRPIAEQSQASCYQLADHLNEQAKRNLARFPADFMFRLSDTEHAALASQIATSISGRGGRRYLPYVFTEHGASMVATFLNSPQATEMSVFIVRAFVELHEALATHKELAKRLDELESRLERKLANSPETLAAIGFQTDCQPSQASRWQLASDPNRCFLQEEPQRHKEGRGSSPRRWSNRRKSSARALSRASSTRPDSANTASGTNGE